MPREEDVGIGIASSDFALDFAFQVIVAIFRFDEGEGESVCVQDLAIDDDAIARIGSRGVLLHEGGTDLYQAGIEHRLAGQTDVAFVANGVGAVLPVPRVVVTEGFTIGVQG